MSEVIVWMEMPTGCPHCPMADDDSRFCKAAKEYIPMLGKPSWCPIIGELPEQHGDLINREYAIASACYGLTRTIQTTEGAEKWIRVREVRESIKSAPIIVPATEISHDERSKNMSEKHCHDCLYATKIDSDTYRCRRIRYDIEKKTCFVSRERRKADFDAAVQRSKGKSDIALDKAKGEKHERSTLDRC